MLSGTSIDLSLSVCEWALTLYIHISGIRVFFNVELTGSSSPPHRNKAYRQKNVLQMPFGSWLRHQRHAWRCEWMLDVDTTSSGGGGCKEVVRVTSKASVTVTMTHSPIWKHQTFLSLAFETNKDIAYFNMYLSLRYLLFILLIIRVMRRSKDLGGAM